VTVVRDGGRVAAAGYPGPWAPSESPPRRCHGGAGCTGRDPRAGNLNLYEPDVCICQSVCLSIYLSTYVYLFLCISIYILYLSIYLSIYLCI
jgi:hypothetical protein